MEPGGTGRNKFHFCDGLKQTREAVFLQENGFCWNKDQRRGEISLGPADSDDTQKQVTERTWLPVCAHTQKTRTETDKMPQWSPWGSRGRRALSSAQPAWRKEKGRGGIWSKIGEYTQHAVHLSSHLSSQIDVYVPIPLNVSAYSPNTHKFLYGDKATQPKTHI